MLSINDINNKIKYKQKVRFMQYKYLKFNVTVPKMSFNQFKSKFMQDFYTMEQRAHLKRFLNISESELNYSLCNQYVLVKYFKRKYYSHFKKKSRIIAKRYYKKYRPHVKKKKRKKKINVRFKKFFRINYDNFLFYLTFLNKQVIVKPFNFLNSLFFFKTKFFQKKHYLIRRRRKHTKLYYKLLRIRGKRRLRRRRIKRIRYNLKKKILFKRFKLQKFKHFKSFFRVIAFMKFCKKKTLSIDDNFKIKSSSRLRYKFLKFNFNKIKNSYEFFMHLKKRKQKIKLFLPNNDFIKSQIKSSSIPIKFKIQNNKTININTKIVNKKKLHLLIFSSNKNFSESVPISIKTTKNVKFNNKNKNSFNQDKVINNIMFPDYLILTNAIKNAIQNNYFNYSSKEKKTINKSYKLIFIIKLITKLSKKILFFEKKLNNINFKQKKKVLRLSKTLKTTEKKFKNLKKTKKIIKKILSIIIKLKNKLKEFILNFYILFYYYNENLHNIKKPNFLKKIYYFLKNKNNTKSTILKKRQHLFSFLSLNFYKKTFLSNDKHFIYFIKNYKKKKKFVSSFDKWVNRKKPTWLVDLYIQKRHRKQKKARLRLVKKHWNLSTSFFYKSYCAINRKNSINNFHSFFFFKKTKILYSNFLKKKNLTYLKNFQKNKNLEFLK